METHWLGNLKLEVERIDQYEAKIYANGDFVCVISWEDKTNFINALKEVIEKYKI